MGRPVCWTSWTLQVRRSTAPWGISTWGRGRASSVSLPSTTPSHLRTSTSTGGSQRVWKWDKKRVKTHACSFFFFFFFLCPATLRNLALSCCRTYRVYRKLSTELEEHSPMPTKSILTQLEQQRWGTLPRSGKEASWAGACLGLCVSVVLLRAATDQRAHINFLTFQSFAGV